MDVDPATSLERVGSRGGEEEMFENLESMEEVRSRMLASGEPLIIVDAGGTPEEVLEGALAALGLS